MMASALLIDKSYPLCFHDDILNVSDYWTYWCNILNAEAKLRCVLYPVISLQSDHIRVPSYVSAAVLLPQGTTVAQRETSVKRKNGV